MTLEQFFQQTPRAAVAFSGGTDSALVLWAAKTWGCQVRAYYVNTAFQPAFELADAKRLAEEVGVPMTVVEVDVMAVPGHTVLLDGTNASDDAGDRPGMQALRELEVRSPLRECGITKDEVRRLSREAGLFTWDKPAYACLATRVPTGTAITGEALAKVERGEDALFKLGFTDFRLRLLGDAARIQMPADQMERAAALHEQITRALGADFSVVLLDLGGR